MSGHAKVRISLYMPRELLARIADRLPAGAIDEINSRSEWIREACRQRLQTEPPPNTMAEEEHS